MIAKNTHLFLLVTILIVLSFSCKAKPTETPVLETKINGKVLDKDNNNAIAGAQVTTNPTTSSVTTDASGSYTIADVKAGQYVVSASKSGYKTNTISVVVTEGKTASADVQIEILKPELTLSTQTIDFGSNQTTASLIITNGSGINSINWTAAKNVNWLLLSLTSGTVSTASNTITLTIDRTGLSFGNYSTNVTVTSNGGNKDVSVTMTVANPNAPQLTVNPIVLDLGSSLSQSTFSIRNSGTGKLSWTANTTTGWISLSPQSDSTTTEIDEVKVTVNRSGLSPGNYSGDVSFLSNAGSQNVNVKMSVPAVPSLSLSTNNLDFDSTKTQLSFNVSNAGTGTLNWSASGNQTWMTVQPQSGNDGGTVNITISKSGISPGNYSGAVTVSSNGGSGNVAIAMRVPFPAPPTPVTATAGAVTTNSIQISWTQYGGSDFAAYKVYYSTSPAVSENSTLATTITTKTTTSYNITGLSSNTTYYFRVFVLAQTQQTSGSNTVSGKTDKTFPAWQQVALPVNFQVQSMHYISENNIWVAGYTIISGYNFPRIYQFNGSVWMQSTVQGQDSVIELKSIAFRNNTEGWATSSNRIYKYDGSSWKVEYYLTLANLVEAIGTTSDVWFYGFKTYRWNGSQLTDQNLSSNTINDMHFYNSTTGFAVTGASSYMFNGVGWIDLSGAGWESISGTSKNDIWRANTPYLYRYDGTNWSRINDIGGLGINYNITQIRMISPTEGWATTSNYSLYYFNGSSWIKQSGSLSGELKEIKDFGNGNLWGIISGSPNKLMRLQ